MPALSMDDPHSSTSSSGGNTQDGLSKIFDRQHLTWSVCSNPSSSHAIGGVGGSNPSGRNSFLMEDGSNTNGLVGNNTGLGGVGTGMLGTNQTANNILNNNNATGNATGNHTTLGTGTTDYYRDSTLRSSIPATKNHTGTLCGREIFLFGGYDGQRNHHTLFVFNVDTHEWSQPPTHGLKPTGRNGHSATLLVLPSSRNANANGVGDFASNRFDNINESDRNERSNDLSNVNATAFSHRNFDFTDTDRNSITNSDTLEDGNSITTPMNNKNFNDNNTNATNLYDDNTTEYNTAIQSTQAKSVTTTKTGKRRVSDSPSGYTFQILILGGWLGNGPLAAGDMHILDLGPPNPSTGIRNLHLEWYQIEFNASDKVRSNGTNGNSGPGPCNMHSSDLVKEDLVLVFRGGDGRAYLNDLHALDLSKLEWHPYETTGELPPPRANHSSCATFTLNTGLLHPGPPGMNSSSNTTSSGIINNLGNAEDDDVQYAKNETTSFNDETTSNNGNLMKSSNNGNLIKPQLFLFGGWDGSKRLNDLYVLDIDTRVWSSIRTGNAPQPRAGMSLSYVDGLLYLFGGSGHTTRCFNDVHVYDVKLNLWFQAHPTSVVNSSEPKDSVIRQKSMNGGGNSTGTMMEEDRLCCVPERRAGHAAVVVGKKLFIFGGACGTYYYSKGKCFILDTDAAPAITGEVNFCVSRDIRLQLGSYFDNPQFSDVTFVFGEKKLYGHRVLLSVFSPHFRGMFSNAFKESTEKEIVMMNINYDIIGYDVFRTILYFIYTGELLIGDLTGDEEVDLDWLLRLLKAGDIYCIDTIKSSCEERLCALVNIENASLLRVEAEKYRATMLTRYCDWMLRQRSSNSMGGSTIMGGSSKLYGM